MSQQKILIIEDDRTIIDALEDTFKFHGFQVFTAGNGNDGIDLFRREDPDLIILDVMLPGPDGFEICKKIRGDNTDVPIIMLTAREQESDKLLGFERGADDYVTKPFSVKVLMARIDAILKRSNRTAAAATALVTAATTAAPVSEPAAEKATQSRTVTVGEAVIDFRNYTVTHKGKEHPLSPKESKILKLMVDNPEEVIHRNRVIDVVWGDDYFPSPRTIDNFILKLRTKIEKDPRNPVHIMTVHGAGYRFRF